MVPNTMPGPDTALSSQQIQALRQLDVDITAGESTRRLRPDAALVDHGVVERGDDGEWTITGKGRRLLRQH